MEIKVEHTIGDIVYLIDKNKVTKAIVEKIVITGSPDDLIIEYGILKEGYKMINMKLENLVYSSKDNLLASMR